MKRGTYILVVGPTGSGKNTLINAAREAIPGLAFAVSATTRPIREGEVDGVNYYYLSREEFMRRVEADEFLEWAEYGGNCYGTLRSEIESALSKGQLILSDIEVQGVRLIREKLPREEYATIYVDAGSWEDLVPRILARGHMSPEDLEKRRQRYLDEASFKPEADYVVLNHDGKLEEAIQAFVAIVRKIEG
jgi:guanylate kinase